MKPILLHGHERAITQIRYNREGDLIFSSAKDPMFGESTRVLTGAADNTLKIWDCETGKTLVSVNTQTAVRTCGWSYSGKMCMYTTDQTMGLPCGIHILDASDQSQMNSSNPLMVIPVSGQMSKVTSAIWGPCEEYIVTGHGNGDLCHFDVKASISLVDDTEVLGVKYRPLASYILAELSHV